MSKWTVYQLLIIASLTALIVCINVFTTQIAFIFSFVAAIISPDIVATFFTIIFVIWGFTFILLLQEKKNRMLFTHKVWRIMPAIMGAVFVLSSMIFVVLGVTLLGDLSVDMKWILDVFILYFLVVFYLFVLAVVIRYGKVDTAKGRMLTSANAAVLILIIILFFIPAII